MIVSIAELQLMAGLSGSITDEERAVLARVHKSAEAKVKQHLKYDPEQRTLVEYYPRQDAGGAALSGQWDVNSSHTRAQFESSVPDSLQLERLPIRSVTGVWCDSAGYFGTASGAFPESCRWAEGTDFWPLLERPRYAPSGIVMASGSWPATPGSVKVQYCAGYSRLELAGESTADSASDQNGQISTAGVDASGIAKAVVSTVLLGMTRWSAWKKRTGPGFVGPITNESAGDYSYGIDGGALAAVLNVELPGDAIDALEEFVNWGVMRL